MSSLYTATIEEIRNWMIDRAAENYINGRITEEQYYLFIDETEF